MRVVSYRLRSGNFPVAARELSQELGASLGSTCQRGTLNISWGCRTGGHADINAAAPVSKLDAFRIFDNNNIPYPEVHTDGWLVRRTVHHGGRDIIPIRQGGDRFLIQFIPKVREYRLDCWQAPDWNITVIVFRSHVKHGSPDQVAWNRDDASWTTYGRRDSEENIPHAVLDLGRRVLTSVGYNFGSVDIIEDESGNYYVLEINSAPRLNESGIRKLANYITRYNERR